MDVASSFVLLDELGPCPVCGTTAEPRPLLVRDERALVGCRACGVAWSHPLPSEEELAAYYASDEGWVRRGKPPKPGALMKRAARRLARKHAKYGRHYELLREHLDAPAGRPRRVLDFGCASGWYLDLLAADGWETYGVEPSPEGQVAAQRHRLLTEVEPGLDVDLLLLNHVVEHLRDPVATLRPLAAATRPGGRVFVSVPSLEALPEHGSLGYVWSDLHVFAYTFAGLRSLLAACGFGEPERLDGPEWEDVARPGGLRVLARRTDAPVEPPADPLEPALRALRAYAPEHETHEARRRARKVSGVTEPR